MRKGADKMVIQEIFRVVYSPLKAFEEIAKAPNVKGPLLILLITLLASVSVQYISSTKTFLQTESDEYVPLAATEIFPGQLMSTFIDAIFRFSINWLIYGVMFMAVLKLFRGKERPWYHLLITIGYTFIVAAIFIFVNAIIVSTLPVIRFEFEVWNGALEGNEEMLNVMILEYEKTWGSLLAYQVRPYFSIIIATWTAALGAVAVHFLREVSWNKAIVVSAIVSSLSLLLMGPLIY
jgi:hypothetical protein